MNNTHPAHLEERKPNETIVAFRLRIDTMINSTKHLKPSREVSLAHTNLQRAFSFLGSALGASGSKSPYTESFNPASPKIEATAEHTDNTLIDRWANMDQTAKVKDFRLVLSGVKNDVALFRTGPLYPENATHPFATFLLESFLAITEAGHWLGWELARIKSIEDSQEVKI